MQSDFLSWVKGDENWNAVKERKIKNDRERENDSRGREKERYRKNVRRDSEILKDMPRLPSIFIVTLNFLSSHLIFLLFPFKHEKENTKNIRQRRERREREKWHESRLKI